MDFILEQELKNEINNCINENLTISNEVKQEVKFVEKYILDNIQKINASDFANGGGKRQLNFSLNLFNDKIKINFQVTNFNFKNDKYFDIYNKKYCTDLECSSVYNVIAGKPFCLCFIRYISIGFIPLPKFYEDVQHEINHLFQQHMEKKTYKDVRKYANISTNIYSDDDIQRNAAEIFYLSSYYEQDGFINGVYNFVKHKLYDKPERLLIDNTIKETDAYHKIYRLKELFQIIHTNQQTYSNVILKDYKMERWDRFDKRIRNAIHRFEKKFAMVIKKCKSDFLINETHTWTEIRKNKFELYKLL